MKRIGIAVFLLTIVSVSVLLLWHRQRANPGSGQAASIQDAAALEPSPITSSQRALLDTLRTGAWGPQAKASWLARNRTALYSLFDRLQRRILWAKSQRRDSVAVASSAAAATIAAALSEELQDSLLIRDLRFLESLRGPALETRLRIEILLSRARKDYLADRDTLALAAYRQALALAESIHDRHTVARTLYAVGDILSRGRDAELARQCLARARRQAEALGDMLILMGVDFRIGQLNYVASRYDEAEASFRSALILADSLQSSFNRARILNRLGRVARRRGDFRHALEQFRAALAIQEKVGDRSGMAVTCTSIGLTYKDLANYPAAVRFYRRAYELHRQNGRQVNAARALANLGNVYMLLGEYEQAWQYLRKALDLKKGLAGPVDIAITTANLGEVEFRRGNYDSAYTCLTDALSAVQDEAYRQTRSDFLLQLGDMYQAQRQYARATSIYRQALALYRASGSRTGIARVETGLGFSYLGMQQWTEARAAFTTALRIARSLASPRLQWRDHYGLARLSLQAKDTTSARRHLLRAIKDIERTRKSLHNEALRMSFFASEQPVYDEMVALQLGALHDAAAAFYYSERSRARFFLDLFHGQATVRHSTSVLDPTKYNLVYSASAASATYSLAQVQSRLPRSVGLVEYRFIPGGLAIWWVTRSTFEVFKLAVTQKEIAALVGEFRRASGADDFQAFQKQFEASPADSYRSVRETGRKLARILIDPLVARLSRQEVVYIIPDGELYYLPFPALVVEDESGRALFLDEITTVATVPSANVLMRLMDRPLPPSSRHWRLLVVADPALPGAETEKELLRRLYPQAVVVADRQLSEARLLPFLEQPFDIIHFATHARINEASPLRSALDLHAPGAGPSDDTPTGDVNFDSDGKLAVYEIFHLRFPEQPLVVLAACETALGRSVDGEGMVGLTQAFVYAGARALVTSLWRVDDRYAQKLMLPFYEELRNSPFRAAKALRYARARLRAALQEDPWVRYPHPYFWAAFIFVGFEPFQPGGATASLRPQERLGVHFGIGG